MERINKNKNIGLLNKKVSRRLGGRVKTIFYTYHLTNFLSLLLHFQKNFASQLIYFCTGYLIRVVKSLMFSGLISTYQIVKPKNNNPILFKRNKILVFLKYFNEQPLIRTIFVYSKPGRKIFVSVFKLKKLSLLHPGSIFFLSTSNSGIINHFKAIENNMGGILLFKVN